MRNPIVLFSVVMALAALLSPVASKSVFESSKFLEPFKALVLDHVSKVLPMSLQLNSCNTCVAAFSLIEIAKVKGIKDSLRVFATGICNKYEEEIVCEGIMQDYFDAFVDNFFSRYLTSQHICVFMKKCESNTVAVDFEQWKAEVLADKPAPKPAVTRPAFKVLHLTDLHTDLEYTEGALASCEEPFCCRPESGPAPSEPTQAALYWGTFAKCDVPLRTVDALLADSKTKVGDIDMIVWTGDNTSHDVWHQTKANQTLPQAKISELVEKHFPGVPKFPIFGNHECFPADQYDVTQTDQTRWMRVESADMWSKWLSPASQLSLKNHGFYAEYDAKTNVKVIALNTQACDMLNFYLIQNVTNPNAEVDFLRKELFASEQNNQKAFIIGHIPYGDNTCSSQWAERIQVIIDRFEDTIIGQFFGHTHDDHVETVMSVSGEKRSVGTVFIAPSGTTFSFHNPSYRIFNFENERPQNYFQYRLDMLNVVQSPDVMPQWDLAYDFLSEYGLPDMSNESLFKFTNEMLPKNPTILAKYMENYHSGANSVNPTSITAQQKAQFTCLAQNAVFNQRFQCLGLWAFTMSDELMYRGIEFLQGEWLNKVPKSGVSSE